MRVAAGEARRFLAAAIDHRGEACLIWPHRKNEKGYGRLVTPRPRRGWAYAHILVCTAVHGPRPEGQEVRHLCGVNGCVNPDHLRWGTRLENAADKVAHGTMARGERVGSAKLTAAQVEEIRERYAAGGIAQEALGREFGVVHATISRIVSGRSWEHAS